MRKLLCANDFQPTFENGGFWELYSDLKRNFCNFLEYVPYLPGNEKTYSFKLLNLFNSIGGYIDSAFKEMARYNFYYSCENVLCQTILERVSRKEGIFATCVDIFDIIYHIKTQKVKFKCLPDREIIVPFSSGCYDWWGFYNDVKHEVRFNLTKANLKNIRDSLAGAFLLNVIHIPGIIRLHKDGIVKEKFGAPMDDMHFESYVKNHSQIDCKVTTPLFMYDYEQ